MAMTDPIADLLTRVRNGAMEGFDRVDVPASRIKANVVKVLKQEGYIRNFRLMRDEKGHAVIKVFLKYAKGGEPVIKGIRRVSRPGLRRYSGYEDIRVPLSGAGIAIVSTSRGVLSAQQCRKQKVGGEVLCEVW